MEYKELISALKEKNCRLTDQRLVFLEVLLNNQDKLLTASEIMQLCQVKYKDINITTVYRNLELLDKLSLIYSLNIDKYTSAYKLICHSHDHHHLICSNCGEMIPIQFATFNDQFLSLIREKGYHLVSNSVDIYGICDQCYQGKKKSK